MMNPHQKNKIDISKLSPEEQNLFRLYGKVPNKKDLLQNKLKERKYFDSGDYALSKAGKASDSGVTSIGTEHPRATDIPHMSPLTHSLSRSDSISAASSPPANPNHPLSGELPHIQTGAGLHRRSISGRPGGGLSTGLSYSPVKESSFLARSSSIDEDEKAAGNEAGNQP
ncbi:hypothetical protein DV735_g5246, partial [Chaetothyriales sp. CBS 134920]